MLRVILTITLLLFSACDRHTTHTQQKSDTDKSQSPYVDFKRFAESRPCAQVRFMCLPESQDKRWQSIPTKDRIEDLEITPDVKKRFDKIVEDWNNAYDAYYSKPHPKGEKKPMLITSLDRDFFDKVEKRRFLEEMEQQLEKEFPGFWRDVPKKVRYRWIRRAMNKAKRFGDDPKQNNEIIELCARIGLDFDKDPKWDYITKFIEKDPRNHLSYAVDYIDYTIFNKEYDIGGTRITDWSMRRAKGHLPAPKKPYPKLND